MGLLNCSDIPLLVLLDKLGLDCNLEVLSTSKETASGFNGSPGYVFVDTVNLRENCFSDGSCRS